MRVIIAILLIFFYFDFVLAKEVKAAEKVKEPTEVEVALTVQQLTDVNPKEKNFTAVVEVIYRWHQPELLSVLREGEAYRLYDKQSFYELLDKMAITQPTFIFYNAYGRRDIQNENIAIGDKGFVTFFQRFSTNFHISELNFGNYPFDRHRFYILLDSVLPTEDIKLVSNPKLSGVTKRFTNEAWKVHQFNVEEMITEDGKLFPRSRVVLSLDVSRYTTYYVLRIFIPFFLIITIAWLSFFLKDYGKRIDVASSNLMAFVAFNFVLASDLPRLGYMTLLDRMILLTLLLTGFTVLANVLLKRMDMEGKGDVVKVMDKWLLLLFPLTYLIMSIGFWYLSTQT